MLREKLTGDAALRLRRQGRDARTWRKVSALDHPDPDIDGPARHLRRADQQAGLPGRQRRRRTSSASSAPTGRASAGSSTRWTARWPAGTATATYELSAGGRRIPSGVDTERDAVPGTDVRLTIDRDIQYVAQKAIAKAVASSQAQSGTVIVYDPTTGDLLAVATAPTFDPNDPGAAPAEDRGDRPLNEAYEPGSTGKVITAAALIQEGVITPTTPITVPNRLLPGRQVVQGLRGARRRAPHLRRHHREVEQHRHHQGGRAAGQPQAALPVPQEVRRRRAHRPRAARASSPARCPKPGDWSATSGYTMTLRAGLLGQRGADGRRCSRRSPTTGVRVPPRLVASTTGAGRHGAARRRPSKRTRVVSPRTAADRPADAGDGARRGRHRAARARSPATGSAARPAPRSGSTRPAAATAATRCRSSGWRRPTSPGSSWRSPCRRPRSAIGGGVQARPGLQAGHVVRPRVAADPADRHQAAQASSSPRTDR